MFATGTAAAQPVYKSVNDQGEVTFSDSPVPNAAEVQAIQVQPGPSEARQQESAERVKRMESQANELGAANAQRAQQRKQAQQQTGENKASDTEVHPVTDADNGHSYPHRSLYPPVDKPPVRPERPIAPGGPGHPVQLPAAPIMAPAR
jgi:hypothetical protein